MKVSISKKSYSSKEEAKNDLYKKGGDFVWKEIDLTSYELYEKILGGYCFSPATYGYLLQKEVIRNGGISIVNSKTGGKFKSNPFDNDGNIYKWARKQEMWSQAQCMFVDIDGSSKDIEEYIKYLSIKPTFGFYTPSDKPEKRRFKLVYCFNQAINDRYLWSYIASILTSAANNKDSELDPCGKTATQMSFQSNGNGVWFGYMINLESLDYSGLNDFLSTIKKEDKIKDVFQIDDEITKYLNIWLKYKGKKKDVSGKSFGDIYKYFGNPENVLISYTAKELKDFKVHNPILDSNQENIVKLTTTDYWELIQTPRKDGEHRRRTLYRRMLLRRILGELNEIEITPELLLVNAVVDRETFIDNSDGVVDMECLKEMVKDAWCKDIEKVKNSEVLKNSIEYLKSKAPDLKFTGDKKDMKQYDVVSLILKYRGYIYQTVINFFYSNDKSIKEITENINKFLEDSGLKIRVSEKTIYKYKSSELKSQKETRDEFIMAKYKEGLSLSKISKALEDNGFESMSKSQISRIIAKLKNNTNNTKEISSQEEPKNEIKLELTDSFKNWRNNSPKEMKEEPKEEINLDFTDYFKKWANL